jgi:hypothetical protein
MTRALVLLLLLAAAVGCTSPARPGPAAEQIVSIQLSVNAFPDGAGRDGRCQATLTKQPDINDVLTWLHSVDWSQSGQDMAVIGLPSPDGGVQINAKDGTAIRFGFFWDGKVVHDQANRLLTGANTTTLRAVALRVCQ